jgi:hypothetical protein
VKDQWTYHAVANVILAHSLIRSFPEVNKEKIALTGISWGGYLTCIVSGIDNRFVASAPIYGCGFLHENSVWLQGRLNKMSPDDKAKWVQLWDPSCYVRSASMPMLFVNGGKDFAYPPDSFSKTYDLVKAPKNLHFVPNLRHGHIFDKPKALEIFIGHHLKGTAPLADIKQTTLKKGQVTADVKSETKLVSAQLHYTLDELPGHANKRKWVSVTATLKGKKISVKAPPIKTTIYFLTVKDERGTVVSSDLIFSP